MVKKIKKEKSKFSVFLNEFIRIKDVIGWSLIYFVGFILGISVLSIENILFPLILFIICVLCITSFTFAINNFYDTDSDKENPRRKDINAIASGKITKKTGITIIIFLAIIPLIFTFHILRTEAIQNLKSLIRHSILTKVRLV